VHRSSARAGERRYHPLRSPYRCEECDERFWLFSLTAWRMGFWGLVVLIALAIIALLIPAKAPQLPPSARPDSGAIVLPNVLG